VDLKIHRDTLLPNPVSPHPGAGNAISCFPSRPWPFVHETARAYEENMFNPLLSCLICNRLEVNNLLWNAIDLVAPASPFGRELAPYFAPKHCSNLQIANLLCVFQSSDEE